MPKQKKKRSFNSLHLKSQKNKSPSTCNLFFMCWFCLMKPQDFGLNTLYSFTETSVVITVLELLLKLTWSLKGPISLFPPLG